MAGDAATEGAKNLVCYLDTVGTGFVEWILGASKCDLDLNFGSAALGGEADFLVREARHDGGQHC